MNTLLSAVLSLVVVSWCAAQDKLPPDLPAGDWRGVLQHSSSLVIENPTGGGSEEPEKKVRALTEREKAQITALIRTQTDEPILSLWSESGNTVRVMTGFNDHPLAGGGHWFTVKRSRKKWRITEQGGWAS